MTGNVRMGVTVIVSSCSKSESRHMHISFGRPLTSALHEPHLPALQFQRTARSPACVAWTRWMASSTTSPVSTSTSKSWSSPPDWSPRHSRIFSVYPMGSVPFLEEGGQLVRHHRERLGGQVDAVAGGVDRQHDVLRAPILVEPGMVVPGVPAARL